MNETKNEHLPELMILSPYSDDEAEEIEVRDYKSITMCDTRLQYSMDVLKKHGGSIRKLSWIIDNKITLSTIFKVLNLMPMLEELHTVIQSDVIIDTTASAYDLTRIKSLHCSSEKSFEFFSSIMPTNCLKEFHLDYAPIAHSYAPVNQSIVEKFEKFIQHQTSIKVFSTNLNLPLNALKLLKLDEFKLGSANKTDEVIKALKNQPDLKTLKWKLVINDENLEEVCKLSKLESFTINVQDIENGQHLGKLKHLKELDLRLFKKENLQNFFVFKLESLEKLSIEKMWQTINNPDIIETISLNFPNLKFLELNSSQKLNFIAKLFPKLEKLEFKFSTIWELDTGIINENLRELSLESDRDSKLYFCKIRETFFELFQIFPNLETLKLETGALCYNNSESYHDHPSTTDFFAKLLNMEKLKSIDLQYLDLDIYKEDLVEFANELKKFARRFKDVKFSFSEKLLINECDYGSVQSKYDSFVNELKKDYRIVENDYDDSDDNFSYRHFNIHFNLEICSGFEDL